jgi:hypothetical protein
MAPFNCCSSQTLSESIQQLDGLHLPFNNTKDVLIATENSDVVVVPGLQWFLLCVGLLLILTFFLYAHGYYLIYRFPLVSFRLAIRGTGLLRL